MSSKETQQTQEHASIHEAMAGIMADCESIGKDRTNTSQGFKFRGIDDVMNSLHQFFAKHRCFVTTHVDSERTEERTTQKGAALIYRVVACRFRIWHASGQHMEIGPVIGEGMESGDKATNKAMSIALKYALLQAFLIPTEEPKDPDAESHDVAPRGRPASAPSRPAAPSKPQGAAPRQASGSEAGKSGYMEAFAATMDALHGLEPKPWDTHEMDLAVASDKKGRTANKIWFGKVWLSTAKAAKREPWEFENWTADDWADQNARLHELVGKLIDAAGTEQPRHSDALDFEQ
jgi:hypothetical protein